MNRAGSKDSKPSAPHGLDAVQKWECSRRHSCLVALQYLLAPRMRALLHTTVVLALTISKYSLASKLGSLCTACKVHPAYLATACYCIYAGVTYMMQNTLCT